MKYQLELTYEELVDEMIADAWYMVTEYHLNLGPKDTLESLVTLIKQKNPELKSKEEKTVIIDFLKNTEDKELISKKRALTYNVPYRLQSPFLENLKGKDWNVGETKLIEKINQENRLIYYFTALNGLATKITIQKDWAEYIVKNQQIIWGWLEYNMILYMDCFWCEIIKGDLVLKEHQAARWLDQNSLSEVEWLPADIALIRRLQNRDGLR